MFLHGVFCCILWTRVTRSLFLSAYYSSRLLNLLKPFFAQRFNMSGFRRKRRAVDTKRILISRSFLPFLTFHLSVSPKDRGPRDWCRSHASDFTPVAEKKKSFFSVETLELVCVADVGSAQESWFDLKLPRGKKKKKLFLKRRNNELSSCGGTHLLEEAGKFIHVSG